MNSYYLSVTQMGACTQLTEYEEFLRTARLYASVLALVNTKSDFTTGVLSAGTEHMAVRVSYTESSNITPPPPKKIN